MQDRFSPHEATGIRRIASELGLSIATVSRALNGKPDVSSKTRQRVVEAAAHRGYQADPLARGLRMGVTRTNREHTGAAPQSQFHPPTGASAFPWVAQWRPRVLPSL